jgi:rhamnogalacturonan endolyase
MADILGDWREEIIYRRSDNTGMVVFVTPFQTNQRMYTLMHDPNYRLAVAWQNMSYNQPPNLGFYFGGGMNTPPSPNIKLVNRVNRQSALNVVQNNPQELIKIYPNPSKDVFNIDLPTFIGDVESEVRTINGVLIAKQKHVLDGNRITIDLTTKPAGVYLLKTNVTGATTFKIIKN